MKNGKTFTGHLLTMGFLIDYLPRGIFLFCWKDERNEEKPLMKIGNFERFMNGEVMGQKEIHT